MSNLIDKNLFLNLDVDFEKENIVFSPIGVDFCMAILRLATDGDSLTEIENIFNMPLFDQILLLRSIVQSERFNVGNLYLYRDIIMNKDFTQGCKDMIDIDFQDVSLLTEEIMNEMISKWASEKSNNFINDVMPFIVDAATFFNLIYFNECWEKEFSPIGLNDFETLCGNIKTEFMSIDGKDFTSRYFRGSNFQAVNIPYACDDIGMVCVLPDINVYDYLKNLSDDE